MASMNSSLYAAVYFDEVNLIGVRFLNEDGSLSKKEYTYKIAADVRDGDYVLCETYSRFSVGIVTDTYADFPDDDSVTYRWAFDTLDKRAMESVREQEKELIRTMKRAKQDAAKKQMRTLMDETLIKADNKARLEFAKGTQSATYIEPNAQDTGHDIGADPVIENGDDYDEARDDMMVDLAGVDD